MSLVRRRYQFERPHNLTRVSLHLHISSSHVPGPSSSTRALMNLVRWLLIRDEVEKGDIDIAERAGEHLLTALPVPSFTCPWARPIVAGRVRYRRNDNILYTMIVRDEVSSKIQVNSQRSTSRYLQPLVMLVDDLTTPVCFHSIA